MSNTFGCSFVGVVDIQSYFDNYLFSPPLQIYSICTVECMYNVSMFILGNVRDYGQLK